MAGHPRSTSKGAMTFLMAAAFFVSGCFAASPPEPDEGQANDMSASPNEVPSYVPVLRCDASGPLQACNGRITENAFANEVDLAIDPDDPDHIVVAAKSHNNPRANVRADNGAMPWGDLITIHAVTFDGGTTWDWGYLQLDERSLTAGALSGESASSYESDPSVAFAPDGRPVLTTLFVPPDESQTEKWGVSAYRSDDGGRTFEPLRAPFEGDSDKPWVTVDRDHNRSYVVVSGAPNRDPDAHGAHVVVSQDGGTTWQAPVLACDQCRTPYIEVGPDGEIYVVGMQPEFDTNQTGGGFNVTNRIVVTRSDDFGATWAEPSRLGQYAGFHFHGVYGRPYRTSNLAAIAVADGPGFNRGDVYVAYATHPEGTPFVPCPPGSTPVYPCPYGAPIWDVFVTKSEDGGRTWSDPVRINDDGLFGTAQFSPMIGADPFGGVHVAWFDNRADATGELVDVFYSFSADGERWSQNVQITDQPFAPGRSVHDYLGIEASEREVLVVWPDTRYGINDLFYAVLEFEAA